ncbi:MAG: hypothetical protein KGL39_53995 [Patescibacteria group bacterium]|nr:hypothetical protein [Patescibacteria group bacterium]
MKTRILELVQSEVGDLVLRTADALRELGDQELEDLRHLSETQKVNDPEATRRVAAYIVADGAEEIARERAAAGRALKP